jgi:hypothetical protein
VALAANRLTRKAPLIMDIPCTRCSEPGARRAAAVVLAVVTLGVVAAWLDDPVASGPLCAEPVAPVVAGLPAVPGC